MVTCGHIASSFTFAHRSPKSSLLQARSSGVEACRLVGQWASHPAAFTHSVAGIVGVGSGRRDTLATRAYHALRLHCSHLHPRTRYKPKEGTIREGAMQQPPLRTSTIYYDDVSSSPCPRAHWYMLTHRAAATRLPTRPRITLHRVPVPSLSHYSA